MNGEPKAGTAMSPEQVALVARREFVENLRTKAFWLGILALPLILLLMGLVPLLMTRAKDARAYAVVDRSGFLLEAVERRAAARDMGRLLQAAAGVYRQDAAAYDRLPQPLRRAVGAYLERPREARTAWVDSQAAADGGLRAWWGALPQAAVRELGESLDTGFDRLRFVRRQGTADEPALKALVSDGSLFAYFVIGTDPVGGGGGGKYVSRNLTDRELRDWFGGLASEEVRRLRMLRAGLEPQRAEWLRRGLDFAARQPGADGGETEVGAADLARQWAPMAFVYLLWIAVLTSSQMLLTSTIEEKSSRIVEILLSSVTPVELMVGKILGMAASGLTVVGTWILCAFVGLALLPALAGAPAGLAAQVAGDPLYLVSFVLYFLTGYLFYASLLVGIGSLCNDLKEAQNLIWPVIILMLVPLFSMVPISQDPNGTLARILSFVPPFTPMVMMNRAAGPPALWEYVATTALLMGAIALVVWGAARVFRQGILHSGRPPLRQVWRWLAAEDA